MSAKKYKVKFKHGYLVEVRPGAYDILSLVEQATVYHTKAVAEMEAAKFGGEVVEVAQ